MTQHVYGRELLKRTKVCVHESSPSTVLFAPTPDMWQPSSCSTDGQTVKLLGPDSGVQLARSVLMQGTL